MQDAQMLLWTTGENGSLLNLKSGMVMSIMKEEKNSLLII